MVVIEVVKVGLVVVEVAAGWQELTRVRRVIANLPQIHLFVRSFKYVTKALF